MGHYASEMYITGSRQGDNEYFAEQKEKARLKLKEDFKKDKTDFSQFKVGVSIRLKNNYTSSDLYNYGYGEHITRMFNFPPHLAKLLKRKVIKVNKKEKLVYIKAIFNSEVGIDYRFLKVVKDDKKL